MPIYTDPMLLQLCSYSSVKYSTYCFVEYLRQMGLLKTVVIQTPKNRTELGPKR